MRHFLQLEDWSSEELQTLLDYAIELKREYFAGGNQPILKGKVLAMIFQKPSLRTRVSFDVGMQHLGGSALYLGPAEIGLGKRESIADVTRVLNGMVHGIMARVFGHDDVLEIAKWASVPVINGLSDERHPCQVMADVMAIKEHFGRTHGLKLAYIGDGNNVASSLLLMCAHFGLDYAIAAPKGYEIPQKVKDAAAPIIRRNEIDFSEVVAPEEAARGADILYTDTWISMGQEDEAAERIATFTGYQVNADLLGMANADAVVMHDLPAYRGKEITDEMMDGPRSIVFNQAHNRLHAQKAILATLMK